MKALTSVFGKTAMAVVLVAGLAVSSCDTQRSKDVKIREKDDGSEDVRIRERQENDSVSIKRERSIQTDEDGYGDTKVKDNTKVDLERDRSEGDNRD